MRQSTPISPIMRRDLRLQTASGANVNANSDSYRSSVARAKHAAILDAARAQFLEHGFTRSGMTDIARRADVSTATLYKHFRSKEILFAEIIERATESANFEYTPDIADASMVENICRATRMSLDAFIAGELPPLMRIVIAEVPLAPDLARATFARISEKWYARTIESINAMIAINLIKPHDTNISARFMIGMVKEAFIWPSLFRTDNVVPDDEDGHKIREIVEMFLSRYGVTPDLDASPQTHSD